MEKIILNLPLLRRKEKTKNRYFLLKSSFQKTIYFLLKSFLQETIYLLLKKNYKNPNLPLTSRDIPS